MKFAKKTKKNNGFSLLESVLSVAVVVIGIVAILPLVSSGLNESMDSRDQVIASMLTQEGGELVQNLRDNNWAQGKLAFDSQILPTKSKNNCEIDYIDPDAIDIKCNNSTTNYTQLNLIGNFYRKDSGTATKFERRIDLEYDTNDNSTATTLTVTSIVIWGSNSPSSINGTTCNTSTKCAYARTVLTRWGD